MCMQSCGMLETDNAKAHCMSMIVCIDMQADSMSSNKEMAQKYKSAADYEDDFM